MPHTSTDQSTDIRGRLIRAIARARPRSPEALWQFVRSLYGLAPPRRAVCPGHVAPMEYLIRSILHPGRDLVVWASRGGAKTELGSVAAHLDSIMRPGCQTRILGGSLDQSEKMYEYMQKKWDGPMRGLLAREPTARRTELVNGSIVEVLTQSPRSVRGQRVHRLKCDEVDEFSPEVWQAAQFVTQSSAGGDGRWIAAHMEVFSTMHRPFGPMAEIVDGLAESSRDLPDRQAGRELAGAPACIEDHQADEHARELTLAARGAGPLLLKWCLWEVIEPCRKEDRSCSRCPLWTDCLGKARLADGYFPIDDAIAQKSRASPAAWQAEMLCLRPRADGLVFAEFDPARHVAPAGYNAGLPLYRAIDFGYANPFVCLWVQKECGTSTPPAPPGDRSETRATSHEPSPGSAGGFTSTSRSHEQSPGSAGGFTGADLSRVRLRVIGEYVARERPVAEHAREMAARDPGPVLATYADPAGWQRSDVTGTGPCQELARLGMRVRTPHAGILEGVELLRRLLKNRPGGPGLVIDPSCRWLIRALQEYHWDESDGGHRNERPAKDGPDHAIDALRYLVTGLYLRRGSVRERRW
jgi:hypothetical protein